MITKNNALKKESNKNKFLIDQLYQKKLTDANRFVCYKDDKRPYSAKTKYRIDITNKMHYSNFEIACNCVKNNPDIEGIGFVFGYDENKGHNYCGLDIDDCINEQGKIHPKALELIEMLDTYTEISRSGKGIHCLFIAEKQGGICKNNNLDFCKCLELYDKGRYFALTGNIIRNKDIEYRQEQCSRIYDMYFKHKEIKAPVITKKPESDLNKSYGNDYLNYIFEKDSKFQKYWNRQITITDESSSDLSFIAKLAYWLDDNPELIKKWFYMSPYYMGKDDAHKKKAHRKDYIDRTIKRAINYQTQGEK